MSPDIERAGNHVNGELPPESVLFGRSEVMQEVRRRVARICPTTVSVLLQGEIGVGKSTLSRFIHNHSPAGASPYVSVNCAAISGPAAGKESFMPPTDGLGVAFAHALGGRATPSIGTLFLDQVSELTPQLQHQLSHTLAECDESTNSDQEQVGEKVRIICAGTRSLRNEVKLGRFRRDLFHRLVVVTIDVPPLRNRIEDLPTISEYLRSRYSAQFGVADEPFPREQLARMSAHSWPGNIRELETYVCRYVVLGRKEAKFA
jgi:DNA-binding NtrC family response regulator